MNVPFPQRQAPSPTHGELTRVVAAAPTQARPIKARKLKAKGRGKARGKARSRPGSPSLKPLASLGGSPQVLAGRYRLERLLGAGGMGVVFRARDLLHEQFGDPEPYVALKLINQEFSESPDASALLYSEFALTRRLRHPNIVRLYSFEVDTEHACAFISMELMRGSTLDQMLCQWPLGLPWEQSRELILGLLQALAYCHGRGVLHGDLKPSNVMLDDDGLRLFDFGLSRAIQGLLPGLPRLNRQRFDAWTPGYAAPELLEGAALSAAADLFAVACVIHELVSGKHPYCRLPSIQAREQQLDLQLQRPRHLPEHCWSALRTALAFNPAERAISVEELHHAVATEGGWLRGWLQRRER
ncbi:serine/threonine-protein kinase [Pseudomonas sp. LD120]|uniref:serine/threonine-protein kinase n=1 Tax=Pseudomonas sp. LD120 TaxID=485751 RepID=UPI001359DE1F|nr:serine/threonine-protein kinase [Pseudomonas sp. LD120]KAF0864232.1 protein kinase [Pseudomonas sp. LD120]